MKKTKKTVFMGLMIAYTLILYIIESMLPSVYFIAPGAKLGLSNIISLTLLYTGGFSMALTVLVIRIVLSSIFVGGFSAFLYSICGGFLSIVMMFIAKSAGAKYFSEVGVSVVGAVSFNIGQLCAAALMIHNASIFVYLPVMIYVSIGTGILVGFTAKFIRRRFLSGALKLD